MADKIIGTIYMFSFSIMLCGVYGRPDFVQQEIVVTKTQRGQVFDCIDFYKQVAFGHPLVKNLTSKVKPNFLRNQRRTHMNLRLKDGGCPPGTVPILRGDANVTVVNEPRPSADPQEHCVAIVHTVPDDTKKFFGSDASLTIYKAVVGPSQWSAARIKLINGQDNIEAGWMVNPSLFNDNEAHLYARFTVAGGRGCINTLCPGFVQVSKDTPLGIAADKYSVIGGPQWSWNISIDKQPEGWWISLNNEKDPIGYWPKNIFTSLAEAASQVDWGGEISNPGPSSQIPEMGNGHKAVYDFKYSACVAHITIVDESFHSVIPQNTKKVWDCEDLYTVKDGGERFPKIGRIIFYGGWR